MVLNVDLQIATLRQHVELVNEATTAWINDYTTNGVGDGITYPFLDFSRCTVEM